MTQSDQNQKVKHLKEWLEPTACNPGILSTPAHVLQFIGRGVSYSSKFPAPLQLPQIESGTQVHLAGSKVCLNVCASFKEAKLVDPNQVTRTQRSHYRMTKHQSLQLRMGKMMVTICPDLSNFFSLIRHCMCKPQDLTSLSVFADKILYMV